MPWGVAAAVAGAATSAALAPSGGGTSGSSGQPYYTPTGLGAADIAWQDLLTRQTGLAGPNPYAGGYQGAADITGQTYSNLAGISNAYGGTLGQQALGSYGAQQALQGAGQQVFQTALDPQSALYNRTQQQLTEQINAGQALRGLGTSAVGGQEYNQAISNFNIDWQNQQLQRQLQGLQGLTGAYGQAGNYAQLAGQQLGQSQQLYAQAPGYNLAAGQIPYQAAQGITNDQITQAQGIQGQIIPYLNYGQGAVQNAYAAGSQNAGAAGALVNQGIQGLGQAAGNYFGSSGGGGYGYTGQGSLFGGNQAGASSGYGTSPVTGYASGANYSVPTYGFG